MPRGFDFGWTSTVTHVEQSVVSGPGEVCQCYVAHSLSQQRRKWLKNHWYEVEAIWSNCVRRRRKNCISDCLRTWKKLKRVESYVTAKTLRPPCIRMPQASFTAIEVLKDSSRIDLTCRGLPRKGGSRPKLSERKHNL